MLCVIILSVIVQNVAILYFILECHYAVIILTVIILSAIIFNVTILYIIMLIVICWVTYTMFQYA